MQYASQQPQSHYSEQYEQQPPPPRQRQPPQQQYYEQAQNYYPDERDDPSPHDDDFYATPNDYSNAHLPPPPPRSVASFSQNESPTSAAILDNSHLRPGNQASLLSHERTLELYRANAKKVHAVPLPLVCAHPP